MISRVDLFREKHSPQTEGGHLRGERSENSGVAYRLGEFSWGPND